MRDIIPLTPSSLPRIRRNVEIPIRQGAASFVTFHGLNDDGEHLAIGFGAWASANVPLVRIHSECLTGDVFGSAKCDCGEQLDEALTLAASQSGLVLYLRQEGRGIGLYNKLDAYELQGAGMDTYEANRVLGFADDLRDYRVAAQMLQALGIGRIRLLSNNPDKRSQLEALGIEVEQAVSTGVFVKAENRRYLEAKVTQTGHLLELAIRS